MQIFFHVTILIILDANFFLLIIGTSKMQKISQLSHRTIKFFQKDFFISNFVSHANYKKEKISSNELVGDEENTFILTRCIFHVTNCFFLTVYQFNLQNRTSRSM